MSDIKSLVKIDRQLVVTAVENYDKKISILEKEAEEGVEKYKDGYKFSWWDRVRGRDKLTSKELFSYDREKSGYWFSMYTHLYGCGLISQESMTIYHLMNTRVRDYLSVTLYSGSEDVYLDSNCLSFIKNNT